MIILASTSDNVVVALSVAVPVDVHATWVDTVTATGAITPGRKNTAIVAAGPSTAAPSPASGAQRNVKTLHIRNKHAATSTEVQVLHTDGVNQELLYDVVLAPGKALQMTDQGGFLVL